MMRIGLVADTHIPQVTKEIPPELLEAFRGVDLILHAGDIYHPEVLDNLERLAPVLAALGDDDDRAMLAEGRVKEMHILQLEGKTLWLVHEKPHAPRKPSWLPEWWLKRLPPEQQESGKPDIIIFGHEHRTFKQNIDGVLFFSPGSPTFLNYISEPGTFGILDLDSETVGARIVHL
jgi:hypothetical protein